MATRFINRKAVRQYALDKAGEFRPAQGFKRVSEEFLEAIDGAVRMAVMARVERHPSRGKTLK